MENYKHCPASFINNIREEGTMEEACDWLQRTYNEAVWKTHRIKELEANINSLEAQIWRGYAELK